MPRPEKPAAPARKGPGRPRLSPSHERAPAVLVRLCDKSGPALMRYSAEHDGCGIAAAVRQLARAWAECNEVRAAVDEWLEQG